MRAVRDAGVRLTKRPRRVAGTPVGGGSRIIRARLIQANFVSVNRIVVQWVITYATALREILALYFWVHCLNALAVAESRSTSLACVCCLASGRTSFHFLHTLALVRAAKKWMAGIVCKSRRMSVLTGLSGRESTNRSLVFPSPKGTENKIHPHLQSNLLFLISTV